MADMLDLLSSAGDQDDYQQHDVGAEGPPEPEQVRKRQKRAHGLSQSCGIGNIGILISSALSILGARYASIMDKMCRVCGCRLGDPDPVNELLTRAWNKPDFGGKVCAYCGASKWKLYPGKGWAEVDTKLTDKEEAGRFTTFMTALIENLKAGGKSSRFIDRPAESLTKEVGVEMKSGVKGIAKLYDGYFGIHGDPLTNGLGHQLVERYKWKDGSIRKVVLVPTTPEDEMETEWNATQKFAHSTELHNGELTDRADHVASLFAEIRDGAGRNQMTGQSQARKAEPAASADGGPAEKKTRVEDLQVKAEDESDDEDMGGRDLMGLLGSGMGAASSSQPAGEGRAAAAAATPGQPSSGRAKAKGKAKAQSNMPPPISAGGGGARRSGTTKGKAGGDEAPDAAEKTAKGQIDRLQNVTDEFPLLQRATLLAMDKKHFKAVKTTSDALSNKMQLLTRPTQDKARLLLKLSQAQVAITKMYKQWVRQNNTQEFLTEYTELENHAKQPPPIVIKVPNCVQVSLMEMRLKHNLLEDLKTGQSVLPRYKQISEDMCRGLFPTTEVADWQKENIDDCLLTIVAPGGDLVPKTVSEHAKWLQNFLHPVPTLARSSVAILDFSFAQDLTDSLITLKTAFQTSEYRGNEAAVNDCIVKIKRSSETTLKMFVSTGTGNKLLTYAATKLEDLSHRQEGEARIMDLLDRGGKGMDNVVRLDASLLQLEFQVDERTLSRFVEHVQYVLKDIGMAMGTAFRVLVQDNKFDNAEFKLTVSDPLHGLQKLNYFQDEPARSSVNKRCIDMMMTLTAAPLAKCTEGRIEDIEVIEDLAQSMAALEPAIDDTSAIFAHMKLLEIPLEDYRNLAGHGASLLAEHESTSVTTKVKEITDFIECTSSAYWKDGRWHCVLVVPTAVTDSSAEAEPQWLLDGSQSDETVDKVRLPMKNMARGTLLRIDLLVGQVCTLLVALRKKRLALWLRLQWLVTAIRLEYCLVASAKKAHDFSKAVIEDEDRLKSAWIALATRLSSLSGLMKSTALEGVEITDGVSAKLDQYRLLKCSKDKLVAEATAAMSFSESLLGLVTGNLAGQLERSSQSLEQRIPSYKEYCVTVFDAEKAKEEIVNKYDHWAVFANDWVGIQKMVNHAKAFTSDFTTPDGSIMAFEKRHQAVLGVASRAFASGRTFISVASTCKLVLETMPLTPKKDRYDTLRSHINKCKGSGLPQNLTDYMNTELQKLKASKSQAAQ
ncbi:unnamed protein product, partial [Prorocentrum cordatum]